MNNSFHQYLPLPEEKIKEIWDIGLIVTDANVLLNIYRYSEDTRGQFLSILTNKNINSRLWSPFQVAYEFHKDRNTVILDQKKPLEKLISIVNKNTNNLVDEIDKFSLHKFHPFLKKNEVLELARQKKNELLSELKEKSDGHPDLLKNDHLVQELHKIFSGKFGEEPNVEIIEKQITEGKRRFEEKRPPGYMDYKKGGVNQYGDFFLWKEIIEKAKNESLPVIFVTDDMKEDWWLQISGKTIGPRPELRDEFYKESTKHIHFYNSLKFFEYANQYLGIKAEESTVNELEKFQEFSTVKPFTPKPFKGFFELQKNKKNAKSKFTNQEEPEDISVDEIKEWFFANYKDPANGVPYESKEGGYQYFAGGPYDPIEEIQGEFPDAEFDLIEQAASEIYGYGFEWVKNDEY